MIFEKVNINDISALVELRIAYLLEDYEKLSENILTIIANNLHVYFQEHLNKDLLVFICRDKNKIVSCCFLCVTEKPSNPTFINGKTGTILNVYTKPEYRKKKLPKVYLKCCFSSQKK